MQFCIYTVMLFVLSFGSYTIITSHGADLDVGQFSSLLTYSFQILMSLMMLSMIFVMVTMSAESAERIAEVLNETSTLTNPASPVTVVKDGSIDFDHVSFKYQANAENYVLSDIDLHIKSGETIGIMGGTGDIIDCENTGEVKVLSALENACAIGCIAGFHSQGHVLSGCKAKGTATASCSVNGIGGLVGNLGNVAATCGEDCVINCTINGGTESNAGMIVGYFNGNSKQVLVGTASNPVKIAGGSLNGTAITADNYTSYIWGSGNASEANHIANVVFGE